MAELLAGVLGTAAIRIHGGGIMPFLILFNIIVDSGQVFWTVKTEAAFSASIGPHRKKNQHPEFKDPSALRSMDMRAPALGTGPLRVIDKYSKHTLHWDRMIPPCVLWRNRRLAILSKLPVPQIKAKP